MTLAYYLHNLNPIIFHLGPITPRWYGFAYLMGFLAAYLLLVKQARDGMLRLPVHRVQDLVLNACIFGVLLGGRLGYVFLYDLPHSLHDGVTPLLWRFYSHFPYWGLLDVMNGGMSAHGGVIFTIITLLVFARKNRLSPINLGDAACMVVPIGLCFGRIANFVNGELYGHPASVPWAVQFPQEIYAPTNGVMDPAVQDKLPEVVSHLYPFTTFADGMDLLVKNLQNHQAAALDAVRAILPARHPSQLYEAILEGVLLFAICYTIGRLWRKDGMASGAFLTFYPVMRIIGEQFRVGDQSVAAGSINAGVIYSILMIVPGLIYWIYWIKRDRRIPWVPPATATAKPVENPAPSA